MLFALINWARLKGINPDEALERTNRKFIQRFQHMEKAAAQSNLQLQDMTLEEMDALWDDAKAKLGNPAS